MRSARTQLNGTSWRFPRWSIPTSPPTSPDGPRRSLALCASRGYRVEYKNGVRRLRLQSGANSDFEFPDGSGKWHRPGALFESKVLGLWPTQGSASVWNEAMWLACLKPQTLHAGDRLAIGCDKARFGDDFTSIVVRRGNCALHHETHNGWDNNQIAGCLKRLCRQFALPGQISCKRPSSY